MGGSSHSTRRRHPIRAAAWWIIVLAVGRADAGPWLVDVTDDCGVDVVQHSGAAGEWSLPEIMAGGLALFDADGDGDLDLYVVESAGANRLLLQHAPWRFRDATERSGLGDAGRGMGAAVGDVDNDGDLDVYVTNHGPDRLYLNDGDGTFTVAGNEAGIDVDGWSTSASFLDFDADGHLDLWVTRYVRDEPEKRCTDAAGRPDYCSPAVYPPVGDVLLRNVGGGRFRDVSAAAGLRATAARGLGVVTADLDSDGRTDVYVANDGDANHYWKNRGDGTFVERALLAGVAYNLDGEAEAGMGVVAEDFDGDGILDLFMTHLSEESNTLYRNRGGARGFEDATGAGGLAMGSLPFTGFGIGVLDLEADGDQDLLIANGRVTRGAKAEEAGLTEPWVRFAEPNAIWLNDGAGRFDDGSRISPAFVAPARISRGLALGDIDRDGDVDLAVGAIEDRVRIFRNDAPRQGHWLALHVVDPGLSREALGAEVLLATPDRRWRRTVARSGSYLSSNDGMVHVGFGEATPSQVTVRWVDGSREQFPIESLDRRLTLERGAGTAPP